MPVTYSPKPGDPQEETVGSFGGKRRKRKTLRGLCIMYYVLCEESPESKTTRRAICSPTTVPCLDQTLPVALEARRPN